MTKIKLNENKLNRIIQESIRQVLSETNWQIQDPTILNSISDENIKNSLQNGSYQGNLNTLRNTLAKFNIQPYQIQQMMSNGVLKSGFINNYANNNPYTSGQTSGGFTASSNNQMAKQNNRFVRRNANSITQQMQTLQNDANQNMQKMGETNAANITQINTQIDAMKKTIATLTKNYNALLQKVNVMSQNNNPQQIQGQQPQA